MIESTSATFEEDIASGLVLVDFHTPTCGPCRQLAPILEKLENVKVVKVNLIEHMDLGSRHNITAVPTMIFFKDGKQVYRTMGFQLQELLQAKINELNR
jgi:thioredoxin 1